MSGLAVKAVDSWLAVALPKILRGPQYRNGSTVRFVTRDEGEGGTSQRCAANTSDIGCRVATIVVSPSTRRGTRSARLFSHYSLLAKGPYSKRTVAAVPRRRQQLLRQFD